MEIDALELYSNRDIERAARLNRLLDWLPRYHTDRRVNAKLINALIGFGQRVLPTRPHGEVRVSRLDIPTASGDLPLRLLRGTHSPRAVYLFFHGGAWVLGNARLDDGWNAFFARKAGVTVAAADFHLAVDDRLDQSIEDAVAILDWTFEHLAELGSDRLIVGGESSGAYLAACALLRRRQGRSLTGLKGFLSFCGAFDLAGSQSLRQSTETSLLVSGPSALKNLERLAHTLPPQAEQKARFSPRLADLAGMPPALFIAGRLDPIVDDSRAMHDRWRDCAGNSTLLLVPEAPHGFERLPTALAGKTKDFACRWMTEILSEPD